MDAAQQQREQILQAIAALEAQRAVLGSQVVNTALSGLHQQLAALESSLTQTPDVNDATGFERRILTIFFSDVVGSVSIAEQLDPEDWLEIINQVHQLAGRLIQEHGGDVLQYQGDGLVAAFGMRQPSERDPEQAILAALALQAALPGMNLPLPDDISFQMRVGIHTGLAVVGELGGDARRELTVTGDTANLAARLQSTAPPGGVLISADTHRYVRGIFEATAQPPVSLKGKSQPVQTYLVVRPYPRPFRTPTRGVAGVVTQTAGRRQEFQALLEALDQACNQQAVIWQQITGEPGIGKSRLMDDFTLHLAANHPNAWILKVRLLPGDERQAYTLVRRMWFDRFKIAEDMPLAQAEHKWEAAFLRLVEANRPHNGQNQNTPLGIDQAHALGRLVGLPFKRRKAAQVSDPQQVKGRAIVVSRQILELMRQSADLIVLLEDLHWADPASWDYLLETILLGPAGEHGLMVLATTRLDWSPPESLLNHPGYQEIPLDSLPDTAVLQLASELLAQVQDLPDDVIPTIVARAEGVPLYAEELVNWLIDRGCIDTSTQPWRFTADGLDPTALPGTLQHLLSTRLLALAPDESYALQAASVFGRNFWDHGLLALHTPSLDVLSHLEQRGLIHPQAGSMLEGEKEWTFHHNLLRDAAYESLLKKQRRQLHHLAGRWLERQARPAGRLDEFAGVLAEHAEQAGEPLAAARWLLRAGRWAFRRGASHTARSAFSRGLTLANAGESELRWQLLLDYNEVLGTLGDMSARQEADQDLLASALASANPAQIAEAQLRIGYTQSLVGEEHAALAAYDACLQAARQTANLRLETLAKGLKVNSLTRLGLLDEAAALAPQVLENARKVSDPETQMRSYVNLSVFYLASGDASMAAKTLQEQLALFDKYNDLYGQAINLSNLGYSYLQLGLYAEGRSALERARKIANEIGSRLMAAYTGLNLGLASLRDGDIQVACVVLKQALQELELLGDPFGQAAGYTYLGLAAESAGDRALAQESYHQAVEGYQSLNAQALEMEALAGLGRTWLASGQCLAASQCCTQVWEYLQASGHAGFEFPTLAYLTCANIFTQCGETDLAQQAVMQARQDLEVRAGRISDAEWRQSFLQNVAEHAAIQHWMPPSVTSTQAEVA